MVLRTLTSPPGSSPSYQSVPYQVVSSRSEVVAGTAITSDTLVIVSPTGGDLVADFTHTSGTVNVRVMPATSGVTNTELYDAFIAAGYSTAGQDTTEAMLSVAVADMLGQSLDVRAFGAVGDGVTDDTTAIQAAIAAGSGRRLYFPPGTYVFAASRLDVTTSQEWFGAGPNLSILQFTAAPSAGDSTSINVYGPSLTAVATLPDSVARGATAITFPSDPGSLSGLLVIRDSASGSFNASRTDYKAGEIVEVASQVTTTVNLKDRTFDAYTASGTLSVSSYAPITFGMSGLRCEFPSGVNLGLRMRRVRDWRIDDCEFGGAALATVQLGEYCYRGTVSRSFSDMTAAAATEQYAWSCTGIQEAAFIGGGGRASRHAFMTGGDAIPNRRIRVSAGDYTLTDEANGYAAVDCHGNAEWIEFVGNQCEGALLAGDNIRFCQNQVAGRGHGVGIREVLGSNFDVSDNDILTYDPNDSAIRANGVTFQSSGTGSFTTRGGTLRVCNNRIVYAGASARPAIYLVYDTGFAVGASTDVRVRGNTFEMGVALTASVSVQGLAGSPLRLIDVSGNVLRNGGFDLRHGSLTVADDNVISGGTAQGMLIRNIGTSEATQSVYVRRNRISGCGFAGIAIQGDTGGNEFALVRLEDNDLPSNSATNQGSMSLEAAIVATEVLLLLVYRNTALTAGANQTYDYSFDNTVDAVQLLHNNWIVGTVANTAASIVQDYAQTYAITNVSTDRACDADTVVVAELADVVGTLIADLRAARIVK